MEPTALSIVTKVIVDILSSSCMRQLLTNAIGSVSTSMGTESWVSLVHDRLCLSFQFQIEYLESQSGIARWTPEE